jgi:hypothetical protein
MNDTKRDRYQVRINGVDRPTETLDDGELLLALMSAIDAMEDISGICAQVQDRVEKWRDGLKTPTRPKPKRK